MNLITFQKVEVGRRKDLKNGRVYLICTIEIGAALIIAGIKGFFTKKY